MYCCPLEYAIAVEYCALLVETPDEPITSLWCVFGGVRRLPTLAMVVGACDD